MNYSVGGRAIFDAPTQEWAGYRFVIEDWGQASWVIRDRATGELLMIEDGYQLILGPVTMPGDATVSCDDCDIQIDRQEAPRLVAMYVAAWLNEIWDQQRANILAEAEAGVIEAARVVSESMWAGHGVSPVQARDLHQRLQTYDTLRGAAES